jgi:hypothetical protein
LGRFDARTRQPWHDSCIGLHDWNIRGDDHIRESGHKISLTFAVNLLFYTFINQLEDIMSIPNYTEMQVKALREQDVTLARAKKFAKTWNKSTKSVIAKAVSLGVYKAEIKATRTTAKPRKADIVAAIAKATQAEKLDGLEKAPMLALTNLLMAIK